MTTASRRHTRRLVALLAIPLLAGAAPDHVIPGPANVQDFHPADDAAPGDLAVALADLGPDAAEWFQHVQTLANPYFGGRAPGTEGHERAEAYVEFHLQRAGLTGAFPTDGGTPSWRQPVDVVRQRRGWRRPTPPTGDLALNGIRLDDTLYTIDPGTAAADVTDAPVRLIGYGIDDAPDWPGLPPDDLDGAVVLLLDGEPRDGDTGRWSSRPGAISPHGALEHKIPALLERGVRAVLVIDADPADDTRPEPGRRGRRGGRDAAYPLPVARLTVAATETFLGRSLEDLIADADDGTLDDPWTRDGRVTMHATPGEEPGRIVAAAHNVAGILPGHGALASEWIVVGAHLDHLGDGQFGTSPRNRGRLHPGADDNASGIAGLLVLADRLARFAETSDADRRSVIFVAFTGEESGLQGSRQFVGAMPVPSASVVGMINMDMIGTLRQHEIAAYGAGTALEWMALLDTNAARAGLIVAAVPAGSGRSDDANFAAAGIPAIHFFTGVHDRYHQPEDQAWTVNPAGAARIIDLVGGLLRDVITGPTLTPKQVDATAPEAPARLGVVPADDDATAGPGVRIASVEPESAAADAGLRAGDVILTWNGRMLSGRDDLFAAIAGHHPGEVVRLGLRRDGATSDVPVRLGRFESR